MKVSSAMGVIPTGRVKEFWDKRKKKVWERVEGSFLKIAADAERTGKISPWSLCILWVVSPVMNTFKLTADR